MRCAIGKIPADHPHVRGEHSARPRPRHAAQDHPHVRGEHWCRRPGIRSPAGPSPRAWGARPREHARRRDGGPSPRAWGAPAALRAPPAATADHPHVRGEHRSCMPVCGPADHPHVRGEHPCTPRHGSCPRTIPTCVGSTDLTRGRPVGSCGPSPRAWGARPATCRGRTIPTCVGTPAQWPRTIPTCVGSTPRWGSADAHRGGPSPRAWGAHLPSRRRTSSPRADHPHVRGEHVHACRERGPEARTIPTCVGSTTPELVLTRRTVRTIPTCVGSTSTAQARASPR